MTQNLYQMLPHVHERSANPDRDNTSKQSKKRKRELTAKSSKELRSVPEIVFSIEVFERQVIELSKKADYQFLRFLKRSTNRDFRIHGDILEKMEDSASKEKGK